MQTFLPYADFKESAAVLDRARLGKQRVENLQIMHALVNPDYGWQNHPAVKMWRGWEDAFLSYQLAVVYEWSEVRGYKDTCWEKTVDLFMHSQFIDDHALRMFDRPNWLGNADFHRSHRSNLLRKKPEHYGPLFEVDLPNDLEYVWPTEKEASDA